MIKRLAIASVSLSIAAAAFAQNMRPGDVAALPASRPVLIASYGRDPNEVGELRLPAGKGPFPVVEVIHGGCWTKGFATRRGTAALATAITAMGYATWNVDYRQVDDAGGGWPGTFQDWAAATDYLRTLAKTQPISLKSVAVVGHSAGAHAALWVASRGKLRAGSAVSSPNPLPIATAIAIDGPGELAPFIGFDAEVCGEPVIAPLMGGRPDAVPNRYGLGSPAGNLPFPARQFMIQSAVLTADAADRYVALARAKGEAVSVLKVHDGGHFDIIAPGSAAWTTQVAPFLKDALARK